MIHPIQLLPGRTLKALVKPELLRWARNRAKVKLEDAAKAAHVPVERLQAWEREDSNEAPTLAQLRELAAKYHFPLAVFYLPGPPKDFAPLRDFRRLTNVEEEPISANLAYHIRSAYERRELALELFEEINSEPQRFTLKATVRDDPEKVGRAIREFLKVDDDSQKQAARQDRAFDFWRRRLEENDFLVFVISGPHWSVELREMRGFTIATPELPVIVVGSTECVDPSLDLCRISSFSLWLQIVPKIRCFDKSKFFNVFPCFIMWTNKYSLSTSIVLL